MPTFVILKGSTEVEQVRCGLGTGGLFPSSQDPK